MIAFTFQYSEQSMIACLRDALMEWISHIEIDQDKYSVELLPMECHHPMYGRLAVNYDTKLLFFVDFYKKYGRTNEGKRTVNGMFHIRIQDEGKDLLTPGDSMILQINDRFQVNYRGRQNVPIAQALMDVLPIRDEEKVGKIVEILGVKRENILFDSFEKRYIVTSPIKEFDWQEEDVPSYFHKYISLGTFHKMLQNKTFRMNSIISQSDTTETFYLGDFLCDDYEDEFKRFGNVLSEKKNLIASFTKNGDDIGMWYDYGDKGKGVCLGFSLLGGQTLHQIQYINEEKSPLNKYREQVKRLKEEEIRIHFSSIDDHRRFVKSSKYVDEKEWRLIVDYNGELNDDIYGDRFVKYKEFPFIGNELKDIGIRLRSITIGPCQPNGTSNFPLVVDRVNQVFGKQIIVNRSDINESEMKVYIQNKEKVENSPN